MEALFQAVNAICGKIQIVSNRFWDFPTNFDWYAKIPILGNFSLAIILLVVDACRSLKHPGCHRRDLHGRSGRSVLDVDLCVLRNVDGFRGGDALPDL